MHTQQRTGSVSLHVCVLLVGDGCSKKKGAFSDMHHETHEAVWGEENGGRGDPSAPCCCQCSSIMSVQGRAKHERKADSHWIGKKCD